MKSARTLCIALAVGFMFHGCADEQQGSGLGSASVNATVSALSVGEVARIQVTVSGLNIAPDIVSQLAQDVPGEWSGVIADIPAGTDRTFVAEASDGDNVVIYDGTVTGVTIEDGVQVVVQFVLQQSTPPVPFTNTVPIFESLVVSSAEVAPGHSVTLTVAVSDPDPGDVPTLLWTATPTGGSFNVTDAPSVVWTAPSTEGFYSLTVAASDSTGATSTLTATIDVRIYHGWGSALIQIDVNAWPQVQNLVPTPVHIDVGETTQLDLTASDLDGDLLAYAWSANCAGTFSDAGAEDPSFTLDADNGGAVCTLTVAIDDGRGGSSTASAAIATGESTAVASFTPLGDLPGDYYFYSWAFDVSSDDTVVVGHSFSPRPDGNGSANEAFRWTEADGMVGLGDLPGGTVYSQARGVSADGAVVVGSSESASGMEAFRWTEADGMVGLGANTYGEAVSSDGTVVVGTDISGGRYEAFRWTEADGMVGLGDLPGGTVYSQARGVSADGAVVVGSSESASGSEAFRWTLVDGVGVMEGLGQLPGGGFDSWASGVSADGSLVVGVSESASGSEAFRWTEINGVGVMEGLGDLPGGGFSSGATAVSADGWIVVGASDTGSGRDYGREAIRWTPTDGMRNLAELLIAQGLDADLAGWELSGAHGVSADGTKIVGYGYNPDGNREAWVATLPLP